MHKILEETVIGQTLQMSHREFFKFGVFQLNRFASHLSYTVVHLIETSLQVLCPESLLQICKLFDPHLLIKSDFDNILTDLLSKVNPDVLGSAAIDHVARLDPVFDESNLFLALDEIEELLLEVQLLLDEQFSAAKVFFLLDVFLSLLTVVQFGSLVCRLLPVLLFVVAASQLLGVSATLCDVFELAFF